MENVAIQIPKENVKDLDLLIQAGYYKSREEALEAAIKYLLKKLNEQDRSTVHHIGNSA